ncbi:lipase family alpha/beta hydrolase [Sandaracinobacteroides saxicola]|uniref:Alpha/beta fold hydrolase n=1 Tax=Sandaracinobacteroides saxicola TaxID=2759707 RepID=A0A7G5IGA7_9SPHN|nr:alpha/beta fold hydrolase [Sandaracinobacteroides saxicola]QMW22399.1 alpha/beta fold hydrolase [Sandaracinobacteroides saxicola]
MTAMRANPATPRPQAPRPTPLALLGEVRSPVNFIAFMRQRSRLIANLPSWPTRTVLVLPGFLSGDWATAPLRSVLSGLGHRVHGWGLGRNLGLRPGLFETLEARVEDLAQAHSAPVALVGWSLGGLFAVELARRHASMVRQVITLGSPVSGDLYANNAWPLYQRVAGHRIDAAPIDWRPGALPPVPFTAVTARGDGVIDRSASRAPDGPLVENVTIEGTHSGLGWNPAAIRVVADRLARH